MTFDIVSKNFSFPKTFAHVYCKDSFVRFLQDSIPKACDSIFDPQTSTPIGNAFCLLSGQKMQRMIQLDIFMAWVFDRRTVNYLTYICISTLFPDCNHNFRYNLEI